MEFDVLCGGPPGPIRLSRELHRRLPVMAPELGALAGPVWPEAASGAESPGRLYAALFHPAAAGGHSGLGDWLWDEPALRREPPMERWPSEGTADPALENAARREVETLLLLARMDCDRYVGEPSQSAAPGIRSGAGWAAPVAARLPLLTLTALRPVLPGEWLRPVSPATGPLSGTDGQLIPVADPDCPRPEELMGYELQRGQVVANTQAMLEGHLVNNVLLFGDGGTGKSATVKSMLFRPGIRRICG